MRWCYRIAKVAGIEVRVHATFFLLLAFYAWTFYEHGGLEASLFGVAFTLAIFLCVVLHEFGHAFAARRFGILTPDITLLPIGGVARLARMPSNPWQELVIALAGPAVNVLIAGLLMAVRGRVPFLGDFERPEGTVAGFLDNLLLINIFLVAFNMIPAFPMDGGRVLRALLAVPLGAARATLIAARVGQGIAILFAVSAFTPFGGPMLMLIAAFVFVGAQQELLMVRVREGLRGRRVAEAMITRFEMLPDSLAVGEIAGRLAASRQSIFPIVDASLRPLGIADREDLLRAIRELPADQPASSVARTVPSVQTTTPFEQALELMQRFSEPFLPVVNASGQIIGLVGPSAAAAEG